MIDQVRLFVLPAAFALLPLPMRSIEATALLLAIGLQESRFELRRQVGGGPARGFWQFEVPGVREVLTHPQTIVPIGQVVDTLRYGTAADEAVYLQRAIGDNDTLAACFARCLLWTLPEKLPEPDQAVVAWSQYRRTWRPGKPRVETWRENYAAGWTLAREIRSTTD